MIVAPERPAWRLPGVAAALAVTVLFGAGTPLAKLLLGAVGPRFMAGLLHLGARQQPPNAFFIHDFVRIQEIQ